MADGKSFCQVQASTREQRAAVRDKAGKEKELLKKRPGNQLVYDTPITEPDPNSISYATSNERFEQDYAGHEKARRPFVHLLCTPLPKRLVPANTAGPLLPPPLCTYAQPCARVALAPRVSEQYTSQDTLAHQWRPPPFS